MGESAARSGLGQGAGVREACIVAGGRGTRLQPLTYTAPKPLLPFGGAPLLAGMIERLAEAGVARVWLVVGADTEPFEVLRGDAARVGVTLEMVPEPAPLDTAGGLRSIADQLDGTVLVLNGDILTDIDYRAAVAHHRSRGADATLVLTEVDDTSAYGVCVRAGSRITAFVEKPAPGTLPGQNAVNAGTYVLEPSTLLGFPPGPLSFERQVFPGLVAGGAHVEGFVWRGVWADLGTPDRYRAGHRLALGGAMSWPPIDRVTAAAGGIRVAESATVDGDAVLHGPVLVLEGARLEAGAAVGPHVVVGREGIVRGGAVVRDSVLFDRVEIGAGVTAVGLVAGSDVTVADGVRLGRDVVLGDGQKVLDGPVADGQRIPAPGA